MIQRAIQNALRLLSHGAHCIKKNSLLTVVIVLAFGLYMLVIMPSGSTYCIRGECGLYFWGAHEHDGIWHIALIEAAFHSWPFTLPIFAGAPLANYNYLFDLVLSILTHTGISSWTWYFKIQPVVWFVLFTRAVYCLNEMMYQHHIAPSEKVKNASLFHVLTLGGVFFASSAGWIFTVGHERTILGSSSLMPMQGLIGMTNPQFMWSLLLITVFTFLSHRLWLDRSLKKSVRPLATLSGLSFLICGLKAYALAPLLLLILTYTCCMMRHQKNRALSYFFATLGGLAIGYLMFYRGSTGGLLWQPFELVKSIYADAHFLPNEDTMRRWYVLKDAGKWSLQMLWLQLRATAIYLGATWGVRVIAFLPLLTLPVQYLRRHAIQPHDKLIAYVACLGFCAAVPSLLFIQKGIWWNSVQFIYYATFFLSFPTGWMLYLLLKNHQRIGWILLSCGMLAQVPVHLDAVRTFALSSGSHIDSSELTMMRHLRALPPGTVYAPPLTSPLPDAQGRLTDTYDTAYIAALTGKPGVIANKTQLELLQVPFEHRLTRALEGHCELLKNASYLYTRPTDPTHVRIQQCAHDGGYHMLFSNTAGNLWLR